MSTNGSVKRAARGRRPSLPHGILVLSALAVICAGPVEAQTSWVDPGRHPGLTLEVLRPEFGSDFDSLVPHDVSFLSSATFLGGRFRLSPSVHLVTELPFAYGDLEGVEVDGHRATLGNPYVGIELLPTSRLGLELGVRAPLADDESFGTLVGLFTEFPARTEAFLTDYVPIQTAASYDLPLDENWFLRFRGGPSLWLNTGDAVDPETDERIPLDHELLASYGGQLWHVAPRYNVGVGLLGRAALTADGDFGERTVHQAGLAGNLVLGRVVPGLQLRIPLDEGDGVDFVVGLNLAFRTR